MKFRERDKAMPKIRWSKRKGEKRLKDKEPKVFENVKKAFLVRGRKTSELSSSFLNDIVCHTTAPLFDLIA